MRSLFPYEPQNSDELRLNPGDIIVVSKKDPSGWWAGTLSNGSSGVFPSNYVEEI